MVARFDLALFVTRPARLEAERGFRKVAGYRAMPTPVAALRARDTQSARTCRGVEATEKAA
jgi:hypothetical protein